MNIKKALTFRASSIGDCLMGKYLLENIHAEFPEARLGIVFAGRADMIRDLFAAYPWLGIVEVNRRHPASLLRLMREWRKCDLVVTQYAGKPGGAFSFPSKIIARLLAKRGGLVGFTDASRWNASFYDHLVPVRPDIAVAEHDRSALRAASIPVSLPVPQLSYVPDASTAKKFGVSHGMFIIVHFFAGGASRSLSPEKSREILSALRQELSDDVSVLVSGSKADRAAAQTIADGLAVNVIAGEATLQEMMILVKESALVVSVDTGMAHIAAQLGASLIVMRSCVGRAWWLPGQYGEQAPVTVLAHDESCGSRHLNKDYPGCLGGIPVGAIVEAVRRRMSPARLGAGYRK